MKTSFLVVFTVVFMACENKAMKKPSNLISEDQMAAILYDMILINSAKGINKQLLEKNIKNPEKYIYKIYNIDSLQFVESNAYYTYKSDSYKAIYEKIEKKLEAQKKGYEALAAEEKRVKDSLKKNRRPKLDTLNLKRQKQIEAKLKRSSKKVDTLQKLPQI
jgi:hypothetical protein